jgi:hypothetical protein
MAAADCLVTDCRIDQGRSSCSSYSMFVERYFKPMMIVLCTLFIVLSVIVLVR